MHVWLSPSLRARRVLCAGAKTPWLPWSCLEQAGFLQRMSMAVLARHRGTEEAEDWTLLVAAEEAESGTRWYRCRCWCCLPGQVQEVTFLCWTWLSCHAAQRTIKNCQGTCEL